MKLAFAALALAACGSSIEPPREWPEADALFHSDPRWMGSDAAFSVQLDDERTLWLFGDTFVARGEGRTRGESEMVRNTIAVQHGLDPSAATIEFHWRTDPDGSPASYFPEDGARWMWPGHGVRIGDRALIFLAAQQPAGEDGIFNFEHAGSRVAILENVDAEVASWNVRAMDLAAPPFDAAIAGASILTETHLVGVAHRTGGSHVGYLVRFGLAEVNADDFSSSREWWDGNAWVRESALSGPPHEILDDAGPEYSVHYDARTARYVHIYSRGFGNTTIAMRTAAALEGPWSSPVDLTRPPESGSDGVFVYAGKAHPELSGGGDLVVTYATNAWDFADLFTAGSDVYYPRFLRVPIPER